MTFVRKLQKDKACNRKGGVALLADTSFIIGLMVGEDSAVDKVREIEEKCIPFSISASTVFKLYVARLNLGYWFLSLF